MYKFVAYGRIKNIEPDMNKLEEEGWKVVCTSSDIQGIYVTYHKD